MFVFLIYVIRLWNGEINWLGKSPGSGSEEAATEQAETPAVEEKQIMTATKILKEELETALEELSKEKEEAKMLKQLYDELDEKYDDETYATSQILYAASEVAAAIADMESFYKHRDDVYDNLMDYVINTLKGFREKNPRIVIHVRDPKKGDRLTHFTHSSGFTHRVKEYQPPIYGSAAGRAWRTREMYYISDVELPDYEYERKESSARDYRTLVCIPIIAGMEKDTCIGVISLTGKPVHAYEKIELERVVLFSQILYPLIWMDQQGLEVSDHTEMGSQKDS